MAEHSSDDVEQNRNHAPEGESFQAQGQPQGQGGRKNFLINPKFQLSFLAYTLGVSLLTIGFFYAADAYFFWKFRQLGQGLGLPSNHVFFQFLDEQHVTKNTYYAVASGVAVSFLTIWGLLLSHRVAGPLYRLKKHLTMVAKGETLADVRFRKGDFFQEVADAYNVQMIRYREAVHAAGLDQNIPGAKTDSEPAVPVKGDAVSGKKNSAA